MQRAGAKDSANTSDPADPFGSDNENGFLDIPDDANPFA